MAYGSVESIVIDGRRFTTDADSGCEIELAGFNTEKKPNGDGTSRNILSRKCGKIGGLSVQVVAADGDLEFLQERADSPDDYPVSLTAVDGGVYDGTMHLTDELKFDAKEGTCEITLEGDLRKLG